VLCAVAYRRDNRLRVEDMVALGQMCCTNVQWTRREPKNGRCKS